MKVFACRLDSNREPQKKNFLWKIATKACNLQTVAAGMQC